MTLHFEEPPPQGHCPPGRGNRRLEITATLTELREHPNRWAVITVYERLSARAAQQLSWQIRCGNTAASAPRGSFESTSRLVGDEARVYARYIGGQS